MLPRLFRNLAYGGIKNTQDLLFVNRIFFINTFSLIITFFLAIFGLVNLFSYGNIVLGYFELFTAVLLLINLIILRFTKKTDLASDILLLVGMFILVGLFYSGGIESTGIFWFYAFPPVCFLLAGVRGGIKWIVILFAIIVGFIIAQSFQFVRLPYSLITVRQMMASLGLVTIISFLVEKKREVEKSVFLESQSKLLDKEEEFKALANNSPDVIARFDRTFSYVYVNSAIEKVSGKKAIEYVGKRMKETGRDDKLVMLWERKIEEVFDSGKAGFWEYEENTAVGKKYFQSRVVPERATDGTIKYVLAVSTDITELKQAQIEHERLSAIVKSSDEAIIGKDMEGIVTSWNLGATKLYGYKEEEIIGKSIAVTIPPNRLAEFRENMEKVKGGETIKTFDTLIVTKQGEAVDVSLTISPIKNFLGEIIGASSIAHDISLQKKVDQMKTEFVSLVSHQLKTPVAELRGYISNMLSGVTGDLTPKQKDYLREMEEININNYRMITDLLNISRLERGVVLVNLKTVTLKEIVAAVAAKYRDLVERDGLKFNSLGFEHDISVIADKDKMVEAIGNIVNNALKYTLKGSISINIYSKEDKGVVEVQDTGRGMSRETLAKLFLRDQILVGDASAERGAGLGLYIAKQFMLLQHGDVRVESEMEKGTTFVFTIPLQKT